MIYRWVVVVIYDDCLETLFLLTIFIMITVSFIVIFTEFFKHKVCYFIELARGDVPCEQVSYLMQVFGEFSLYYCIPACDLKRIMFGIQVEPSLTNVYFVAKLLRKVVCLFLLRPSVESM